MIDYIDYRKSYLDVSLKSFANDDWSGKNFIYVIVSLYSDDKFYYNIDLKEKVALLNHASIFYTKFDAYGMLSVARKQLKDEMITVKKVYPWARIASLQMFLHDNYKKNLYNEGWTINRYTSTSNFTYDFGMYKSYLGVTIANTNAKLQLAFDNAKKHGIIMDNDDIIIGMDWNKFNDTLYLWQVQELGLL